MSTIAGCHIDLVLVSSRYGSNTGKSIHFWLGENMTQSQLVVGLQIMTLSEKFGILQ